ncbi:hypothetical protein HX862_14220 [Pseudomonas sp. D5002]|uniref:hypothetical protein n=1 Tax=Pseudomonas sp. D5002 TaxID=2738818 RepID=UPI00159F9E14|nr:hypothetical protein [Pseudomonas sp. D5002]NWB09064.1 hypothetical protein [Pseudomonas sp. D5002]
MSDHIPASGERAAGVGYVAQYRIAADLIYDALLAGKLEWIALADPDAGRVDDIQFATPGRIDAYQVKWSVQPDATSFNQLVQGDGDPDDANSHGLIGQLAGGWQRLCSLHPTRKVVVHLVTRDFCAPQAQIPHSGQTSSKANLFGFLTDCWQNKTWTADGIDGSPAGWKPAIEALQSASNLTPEDFLSFVHACDLRFSFQLDLALTDADRSELRRQDDIDVLAAFLQKTVGSDRRVVRMDLDSLLDALGWGSRFKSKFQHDFPVDQNYQPILDTVQELDVALMKHSKGYLALLGTPGAGKSTTLTHTLRYRKGCRLVRYYAFVPDTPFQGRGESGAFLHDLVLELQRQGAVGQNAQPKTHEELLSQFSIQLDALHNQWTQDGICTVILVDGLDHIAREQSPKRSLLLDLPHPSTIPDGIVFVLGSQTVDLPDLSPAIKAHLQANSRTIEMRALSRAATLAILSKAEIPVALSPSQKDKIFQLSDGHPLALSYLLKQLLLADSSDAVADTLDSADPYRGHIDRTYDVYWEELQQDEELKSLLALVSRLRIPFDPRHMARWVGDAAAKSLVHRARRFFRTEVSVSWRFFHNSFRQYIVHQTSRDILGEYSLETHRDHHKRLATYCDKAPENTSYQWQAIYHLACSEQWHVISQRASQARFRSQFYGLRDYDDILDDIDLAARAAREQANPINFLKLVLIEHELSERQEALERVEIAELILAIDGESAALNYALDGNSLRLDRDEALRLCRKLVERNELASARRIFDVAEPLDWFSGAALPMEAVADVPELDSWLRCAIHFRPLDVIVSAINSLTAAPTYDEDSATVGARLKQETFITLTDVISEVSDSDLWKCFTSAAEHLPDGNELIYRLNLNICIQHPTHSTVETALSYITSRSPPVNLDDLDRVTIAEAILRIRGDKEEAFYWIQGIQQPETYDSYSNSHIQYLSPFILRVRFNRLLSSLGIAADPANAIPSADTPREQAIVLFERQIASIAMIWGKARAGETLPPSEIVRLLQPALRFYNRDWKQTKDWSSWHELVGLAGQFFEFVAEAVAAHGPEALFAFSNEIDAQWQNTDVFARWPLSRRRLLAVALYRLGDDRQRLLNRLSSVESQIDVSLDVHERIEEYKELILAFAFAKEPHRAKPLLAKLICGSFGIYHDKDRQLQLWVDFLATAGGHNFELVKHDISAFASALLIADQNNRGRGIQDAATELLSLAFRNSPSFAWTLFSWLIENGGVQFSSGVAGLLSGVLVTPSPPTALIASVTKHLYVPFTRGVYTPLATALATRFAEELPAQDSAKLISDIEHAIKTKAWPTDREEWWSALADGLINAGQRATHFLEMKQPRQDSAKSPDDNLTLRDGTVISAVAVIAKVDSPSALIALLAATQKSGYFPWDSVVSPVLASCTLVEAREILRLLTALDAKLSLRSRCALKLHQLGDSSAARAALLIQLEQSAPQGWDRRWDGGSRLHAMKALIQMDTATWRPTALNMLIDDYLSGSRYPFNLISNFKDLAEILFTDSPWNELWPEVREHVFQLAEFDESERNAPLWVESNESAEQILIRLIAWASELPISAVRHQSHNALAELIGKAIASDTIVDHLRSGLQGEWRSINQALAVVNTSIHHSPELVEALLPQIHNLSTSPDLCIRLMATELAEKLNSPAISVTNGRVELPAIYHLQLPELRTHDPVVPSSAVLASEVFPDSCDPLEMVRPHDGSLRWLSHASNIPVENLLERTASLMRSLQPESSWSKASEQQIRDWLETVGLAIPYNRARPQAAIRAISHVASELLNAGMLSNYDIEITLDMISVHDHVLARCVSVERPLSVGLFIRDTSYRTQTRWIEEIDSALYSLVSRVGETAIVVGELTTLKEWDWKEPIEQRYSMVCAEEWSSNLESESAHQFFPHLSTWRARHYPYLDRAEVLPSLITHGSSWQTLLGPSEWLAFNPYVAESLDWRLSEEGVFRWVDADGNTMVESLWWQDGPMHRKPERNGDVTAEGWIVTAHPDAFALLQDAYSGLTVFELVTRSIQDSDTNSVSVARQARSRRWSLHS